MLGSDYGKRRKGVLTVTALRTPVEPCCQFARIWGSLLATPTVAAAPLILYKVGISRISLLKRAYAAAARPATKRAAALGFPV